MLITSILSVLMVESFKGHVLMKFSYFEYIHQNVNRSYIWESEFLFSFFCCCLFIFSKVFLWMCISFVMRDLEKKNTSLFGHFGQRRPYFSSNSYFLCFCIIVIIKPNLFFMKFFSSSSIRILLYDMHSL